MIYHLILVKNRLYYNTAKINYIHYLITSLIYRVILVKLLGFVKLFTLS